MPTINDWDTAGIRGILPSAYIRPAEFDKWLRDHDRDLLRSGWSEGAASRQCHCSAYSEGECACGMYPSEINPYRAVR